MPKNETEKETRRRRGCSKEKDKLEKALSGDSSASTRHYVATETNLYMGKTKTLPKIKSRGRNREKDLGGIIFKERSLPNWKPATVSTGCTDVRIHVLQIMRETKILPRNKTKLFLS